MATTATTATSFSLTAIGHSLIDCFTEMLEWLPNNGRNCLRCAIGIGVSIAVYFLVMLFFRYVVIKYILRHFKIDDPEFVPSGQPFGLFFLWAGISISVDITRLPPIMDAMLDRFFLMVFAFTLLALALNAFRVILGGIGAYCKRYPDTYPMRKLLLDLIRSIVRLLLWCTTILFVLQCVLEINISNILVGAGVMGMGVAFAAQNTIANMFGAFQILGSRLFKVGDRIIVDGTEGIVEKIGFRSVSLRAAEGLLIAIPNRIVADSMVQNLSDRKFTREYFCFGLVYQTTPEQIQLAKKILAEIGKEMSYIIFPGKPVVSVFNKCNDFSLDVDCYVWFKGADVWKIRSCRDKFNSEVFKRFIEAGLSFAYPTSSVFLESSSAKEKSVECAEK